MLSSRFLSNGKAIMPNDSLMYLSQEDGQVKGVFLSDKRGYLLLSRSEGRDKEADIVSFCQAACRHYPPYCVAGTPAVLDIVQPLFQKTISRTLDYDLMVSTTQLPRLKEVEDIAIHGSRVRDHAKLLKLELKYQEEEVFARKLTMHDKIGLTLLYLEKLKSTVSFHAWCTPYEVAIAKAEIGAVGFNYLQLGGVYTLPPWRNKGVATHVVRRLIHHAHDEKKYLCLFVNKTNASAIKLYQKLRMERLGDFRIYYVRE